jgi:hypothetical protein
VAGATHLVAGASDISLDGGVRFLGEFSATPGAFASGQVLNFGSLAYIVDCHGKLHLLGGVAPASSKLLAPLIPSSPLGARS